ncbi:unnamed protein product [Parnassius mnemosyne]|uniref:Zinc finger PHD-type domain-containing protein n=1 Tax=Parnassius mnemosyne TaxID=213953 RepID=A0AAV1L3W9_9NEOP
MVKCKKCNKAVSTAKDETCKCKGSCEAVFHKKCVTKATFKNEKCEDCVSLPGSHPSSPSVDGPDIAVILADMNRKMEVVYKMEKKLSELADLVDFVSEKYDNLMEYQKSTETKIKSLENMNAYLVKCNKALEERVNELEEKDKEKKVELAGLEKKENEDVAKIIVQIANKLQMDVSQIEHAERVGREKPNVDKPLPVVVTLRTKEARDKWIEIRKKRLTNGEIYGTNNDTRIYINENLTRYKRNLLWVTKNQLKKTYKYIWVQDGKILIRKSDEQKKIMSIRSERDIEKYIESNVNTATG